jgi:thymidylate synthase ThyX
MTKPSDTTYKTILENLVCAAGGRVSENIFVEEPGVVLALDHDGLTSQMKAILKQSNIHPSQNTIDQLGEFGARLTFLSFPEEPETLEESQAYNHKIKVEYGHLSPYDLTPPLVFIAGCSIETSLELVSHRGKVARLTSSKTKAMDNPLFRIQGTPLEREAQKEILRRMLKERNSCIDRLNLKELSLDWREYANMTWPASKATALLVTMGGLRDWKWVLEGRLGEGARVETELREVCLKIADILSEAYPESIRPGKDYQ